MKIKENEKCPVCDKIFSEEDDIVFCPQCGTPHHRECYNSLGRCANADKHLSGFEYRYENSDNTINGETTDNQAQRLNPNNNYYVPKTEESNKTICKNCSKEISNDVPFCPYCGAKQENPQYKPISPFMPKFDSQNRVYQNSNETIDGKSISDVAAVVKTNIPRFISRFKKNKKISWNWGGFIFGPFYLFYRKMYKEGIIILVLRTVANLVVQGIFTEDVKKYMDFMNSAIQNPETFSVYNPFSAVAELFNLAPSLLISITVISLVWGLVVALLSDGFYRKKVMDILDKVDENLENGGLFSQTISFGGEQPSLSQDEMRKIYLSKAGGTSIFIPIIAYFALDMVLNIISML